MNIFVLLGIN